MNTFRAGHRHLGSLPLAGLPSCISGRSPKKPYRKLASQTMASASLEWPSAGLLLEEVHPLSSLLCCDHLLASHSKASAVNAMKPSCTCVESNGMGPVPTDQQREGNVRCRPPHLRHPGMCPRRSCRGRWPRSSRSNGCVWATWER